MTATLVGLVAFWPGGRDDVVLGTPTDVIDATVIEVEEGPCAGTQPEVGLDCAVPTVRLDEGPDAGRSIELAELSASDASAGAVVLEVGDRIVLGYYADSPEGFQYSLSDFQRRRPLALLGAIFALAVVALGRWLGVRALVATGLSLGVLVTFILPAILEGSNPTAVALVGSSLVAALAIYLSHGFDARSGTAVVGTLASLGLVAVLAWAFTEAGDFTGLADEDATFLQLTAGTIDLRGLVLAGMVIGTLGVLDDVTVTQVSAVWELRRANPAYGWRELYGAGVRIGRDHIASAVNTLVLAYAGASLPLFLLFSQSGQALTDVLNTEVVAVEIVRTLTGSIGLVAAVPLTTALAAVVVSGHDLGRGRATAPRPAGDARRRAAERLREPGRPSATG